MSTMASHADQASDLLQNLSLDSQTKTSEIPEPTKKSSVDIATGKVQPGNKSLNKSVPDYMDPSMAYYPNAYASAYYYGGYDGTTNDWDDYSRYMNPDGVDLSQLYGYGYSPYGPYSSAGSPMPTVGQDGQLYQYPSPYFQPTTPYSVPPKGDVTTTTDNKDTTKTAKGNTVSTTVKPTSYQNLSYGRGTQNGYIPWLDSSIYSDPQSKTNSNNTQVASRNLNGTRPMSAMNATNGYMNRMYPSKLYGQYGNNTYRSGYGYGYGYDLQSNGRGWLSYDNKYKPRGRGNGFFNYNENADGLNELNRGPRARSIKYQKGFTPITVKGQDGTLPSTDEKEEGKEVILTPDREQYNKEEFLDTYENAKFFIIKSYSEDDVHKSIKYNVWASTQNGNKKLDAAYQEGQNVSGGCPVFLFFSVNTSGQFVGVAEMTGAVDFEKSLEYWQQDKWIGGFPVKWHIVKDLPNSLLKHIILENNENKPVTNSRDTQEVKLEQGLQMLKIFKEHSSKQCILDDFEFYEDRQKKIQEKKARQQQYQKQIWGGKLAVDDKSKGVEVADVADLGNGVATDVEVSEVKLEDNELTAT